MAGLIDKHVSEVPVGNTHGPYLSNNTVLGIFGGECKQYGVGLNSMAYANQPAFSLLAHLGRHEEGAHHDAHLGCHEEGAHHDADHGLCHFRYAGQPVCIIGRVERGYIVEVSGHFGTCTLVGVDAEHL